MSTDPRYMLAMQMIQDQIAQGRLQLDRDIYQNIQLPTYQNITYPTSVGQNTGYLPQDYAGGYGGLPTFGALTGVANQFGNAVGTDPRWAQMGIHQGDLTLGGQAQRLAEDAQRARQDEFNRTLGMEGFNADQARFNDYRDQANKDRAYALDINADPNTIVAGQTLPAWLQPHAEWARQFASQNGGRLPTEQDLRNVLGGYGRTIEGPNGPTPPVGGGNVAKLNADYQALKAQAGGDLSYDDPRLLSIYRQDLGGSDATNTARAQAVSDWSRAHPGQTPDATTQLGLYQNSDSLAAKPAFPANPTLSSADDPNATQQLQGGQMDRQYGGGMIASPNNPLYQRMRQSMGGGQQYGGDAMMYRGGQGGFGVNYNGSGYTAGIGQGQPMSLDQRRLIEQGRQADIQAQLGQHAQRIQQQYQMGQLGLQGQQNRLAREQAYGGSAYLGGGQTLADRAQQQQTALQALQQESQLRADPFQLAQYRYGLNNAGINNVIGAVAGSGVLPGVQGGHGQAPQAPTLGNQIGQATGGYPTFGQGGGGMAGVQQQLAALPQLNQINGRNYLRAGAGGQQYVNSAYRAAGLAGNDQDVTEAVQRGLPQFARRGVPTFGRAA